MRAVEVAETGGPEVLSYVDKPQPSPAAGEVVIRAEAIGINYVDTYFRSGQYPAELPLVVGNEVAGTVSSVGSRVTALKVGDRAVTASAAGAYAEYSTAPASLVAQLPSDIDFDVAAAALLKGMT
ncbi:MAG: alcohol dehydrogenase catalytic domain-containing protein, partial [Mycobacterium sp.]